MEQYKKQVTKLESECTELSRVKHALQAEKQILITKADGAEYQRTKDQERIRNLDERIRELESGIMSEAVEEYGGDLHSELAYSTKTKTDMSVVETRAWKSPAANWFLGSSSLLGMRMRSDTSRKEEEQDPTTLS